MMSHREYGFHQWQIRAAKCDPFSFTYLKSTWIPLSLYDPSDPVEAASCLYPSQQQIFILDLDPIFDFYMWLGQILLRTVAKC